MDTRENRTVLWLHNYPDRNHGRFMWDAYDVVGEGFNFHIVEKSIPLNIGLNQIWPTYKQIKEEVKSFEIVHGQFGSLVGLMSTLVGRKSIITIRGSDFYGSGDYKSLRGIFITLRLTILTYLAAIFATHVVVVSERLRRSIIKYPFISASKVSHIDDCVSEIFYPKELKLNHRDLKLRVFFGSLDPENKAKRQWITEEAERLCQVSGVGVRLEIANDLSREDFRKLLDSCDIIATSSTHEGLPGVIKEAILMGKPYIGTDVSDLSNLRYINDGNQVLNHNENLPLAFALLFVQYSIKLIIREYNPIPTCERWHPFTVRTKLDTLYSYIAKIDV